VSPRARRLLFLISAVIALGVIGVLFFRRIPEEVSAPLFLLAVIVEVIVAPLPGGVIGYMGAARFGFLMAWPLLYLGNIIGTTLLFILVRHFGAPIFAENVSETTRRRYEAIVEGNRLLFWIFYAIPIIPVDFLSVIAGLSKIRTRDFLLVVYTGFIIYTALISFVGSTLADFIGVANTISLIGAVFFLLFCVALWQRHRRKSAQARAVQ
jgi:uncharacterized membrane protein YdjX (TVP38/TMEM64 family)